MIYEPREDSELLAKYVKKFAFGNVLDIGTGSAIQAITAAKKKDVKNVIAADIQKEVIEHNKKKIKNKKIRFIQSDLFSNIKNKFNTIIFNPPYLPEDAQLKDLTVDGGKKGYEVLERFLYHVNDYLKEDGIILIVFSSLTKKDKVNGFIEKNLLEYKELNKKKIFFEELYVYLLKKSDLLKKLEKKVKNIRYFTKGHRGILFTGFYGKKKVVIKAKLPESKAIGRIQNEIKYLKILNKKNIGPKLLFYDKDYFVYEFIEGDFIGDYFEKSNKNKIKKIIKDVFKQLFIMDKLKTDKEEMHHPYKHIVINKNNKMFLFDFERCRKTKKPKNVTQFCQFLINKKMNDLLRNKKIKIDKNKIIELAKRYKKNQNRNNLDRILNSIGWIISNDRIFN